MTVVNPAPQTKGEPIPASHCNYNSGLGNDTYPTDEQPPSYEAGPGSQFGSENQCNYISPFAQITGINYDKYSPPQSSLSEDKTTVTCGGPQLLQDATALADLIDEQILLPPKPIVRVRGTYGANYGADKIDFDLALNLMPLIMRGRL